MAQRDDPEPPVSAEHNAERARHTRSGHLIQPTSNTLSWRIAQPGYALVRSLSSQILSSSTPTLISGLFGSQDLWTGVSRC